MIHTVSVSTAGNYKFDDRQGALVFEPRGDQYAPVEIPVARRPHDGSPIYSAVVSFARSNGYPLPGRVTDPVYDRMEALANPQAL